VFPPKSPIRAKSPGNGAVKASLCGAILIVAIGFTSFASSADSPSTSLNQQTILKFLTKAIDWNQQQSLDKSTSPGADDIAFANVNLPAADQVVQLSFEFARADAKIVRSSSTPASADSRHATLMEFIAKLQESSNQDRAELQSLQEKLSTANRRQRPALESQIARLNS